uniref:Tryptophan synthase alpha chain n=1 Tax=Lophocladia kuetzingii TaxID=675577 RepID=A0A1Z1MNS3_9FLOR|nr:Tryptophan synthase alpha subunit [Lophocladia kuetzingii]ARW67586.1 Tryptophan synthase alpha subunit [Lophocladia kuetzingii]
MNLISKVLEEKRNQSTSALIPFITAGYPDISTTVELLYTLSYEGADIIELGIPYSDALADGPLIQYSSKIALSNGTYIDQVLAVLKEVSPKIIVPIVIFTYYNPILVRGLETFIKEASVVGVKGLIVPDLPIEETDFLSFLCTKYNIELILFIAPTSSKDRISNILSKAPGSVYLVSSTGVTGIREDVNNDIKQLSNYIRSHTNKLIMLGFGISQPSQVSLISQWCIDGIVVGSAFIRILSNDIDNDIDLLKVNQSEILKKVANFCKDMKLAIKS